MKIDWEQFPKKACEWCGKCALNRQKSSGLFSTILKKENNNIFINKMDVSDED